MAAAQRKKQMKEYREAFLLFDKDRDGTITTAELETVMKSLRYAPSQAQLKAMIAEVDSDGNGVIEFDEFVTMLDNCGVALEAREREMRAAFSIFDKDNDGFITAVELRDTLSSLGQELSIDELNQMMAEADRDGDGRIDYAEFAKVMIKNNIF